MTALQPLWKLTANSILERGEAAHRQAEAKLVMSQAREALGLLERADIALMRVDAAAMRQRAIALLRQATMTGR